MSSSSSGPTSCRPAKGQAPRRRPRRARPIAGSPSLDPFEPFRAAPRRAAICTDFDGTLSAIVDDPAEARPVAGAVEVLADLAARYAVVAVVSGRPASFLQATLPATVDQHGLYGLERVVDGVIDAHPAAATWRDVVDEVAADAAASVGHMVDVEHKGLSLTLHFRASTDQVSAARVAGDFADGVARATGLALRMARMSIELHPPVAVDKGTVLAGVAAGLDAACFVGDDAGDLPAFDALDQLAAAGLSTVRVAVQSAEAPAGLLERADLVVDSPAGVVALLRSL